MLLFGRDPRWRHEGNLNGAQWIFRPNPLLEIHLVAEEL
jgi:hypothetical protein